MATVHEILEKKGRHVHAVGEGQTVLDAARAMNTHRIGSVVVTRGDRVVGIFTERDILCRVVAEQRDPGKTLIKDVMTSPVAVCSPQTTREECRGVMRSKRLRHLPVVDNEKLVGMVSIGDVNADAEEDQAQTIKYLYEYMLGEWS